MTSIQFDECFDDLEVIDGCNSQSLIEARRLDENLFGKKDPIVLGVLMQRERPVITTDRALPNDHMDCIPDSNPGIIVIAYCRFYRTAREAMKTMTSRAASRLLAELKRRLPDWHTLEVSNSVVEITNKGVMVSHVERGKLRFDKYLLYDSDDWPDDEALRRDLVALLNVNFQRFGLPGANQGVDPQA